MVNLNKMYDGVVNSPETYLTQNLAADATIIYVADGSVFGELPNIAVIGTDQTAETILVEKKRSDGGYNVKRSIEGNGGSWTRTTPVARNFTNFDYQQIKDNIEKLNAGKQDSLTAGSNIQITNGIISATDTKYDDTQIKKDITELQNSQLSKASQKEAESGADNTKYMTPQATKQAIEKLSPKQDLSGYAIKKDIKIKLSEMEEDSTHRTVTDSEKEKWNGKFDLPVGKENQVLTKTSNGAEFKNISSSRSATFVIANYDSSENSKSGADYIIQESDCAAEIINDFIAKLPSYGGKIQLTEGNFNTKKNLSINFTKNNVIIEGYGDSTTIIDKLTKDERNSVIVNIPAGIENCRLSDLNITHDTSNSINTRGNKNYIKNVNIINNGSYPSLIMNDNTSENVLENCSVKCDSNYCYWTRESSKNNKILNCKGTSTNDTVFNISGSNSQLVNCNGITNKSLVFYIGGSNNQLTNCSGVISITSENTIYSYSVFLIKSSNNQLLNCKGIAPNNGVFQIESSNNQLTNCSGITNKSTLCVVKGDNNQIFNYNGTVKGVDNSFPPLDIYGTNNLVIGCNLIGTRLYFRVNGSKHLIVNNFLTRDITNKSTNSIINNNIVK